MGGIIEEVIAIYRGPTKPPPKRRGKNWVPRSCSKLEGGVQGCEGGTGESSVGVQEGPQAFCFGNTWAAEGSQGHQKN